MTNKPNDPQTLSLINAVHLAIKIWLPIFVMFLAACSPMATQSFIAPTPGLTPLGSALPAGLVTPNLPASTPTIPIESATATPGEPAATPDLPTSTPTIPIESATATPGEPTATPNPYRPLQAINPSELTIQSFLEAMPPEIHTTHENPSAASQEQKDAHDQWISNAWKAIFTNLTDAELSQMNLQRADIDKLGIGPTGEMYTEVNGKEYPVYDYSLLRAMESFSQEFGVYQAPFMIGLGEQIKTELYPIEWTDS